MTAKPTTMSALSELIARVEKATGPDREIDQLVALACIEGAYLPREEECPWGSKGNFLLDDEFGSTWTSAERYTASLDSVIGLVERELPDFLVTGLTQATVDAKYGDVRRWGGNRWKASLAPVGPWLTTDDPGKASSKWPSAFGPSPALALLLAFLKAKEAQTP